MGTTAAVADWVQMSPWKISDEDLKLLLKPVQVEPGIRGVSTHIRYAGLSYRIGLTPPTRDKTTPPAVPATNSTKSKPKKHHTSSTKEGGLEQSQEVLVTNSTKRSLAETDLGLSRKRIRRGTTQAAGQQEIVGHGLDHEDGNRPHPEPTGQTSVSINSPQSHQEVSTHAEEGEEPGGDMEHISRSSTNDSAHHTGPDSGDHAATKDNDNSVHSNNLPGTSTVDDFGLSATKEPEATNPKDMGHGSAHEPGHSIASGAEPILGRKRISSQFESPSLQVPPVMKGAQGNLPTSSSSKSLLSTTNLSTDTASSALQNRGPPGELHPREPTLAADDNLPPKTAIESASETPETDLTGGPRGILARDDLKGLRLHAKSCSPEQLKDLRIPQVYPPDLSLGGTVDTIALQTMQDKFMENFLNRILAGKDQRIPAAIQYTVEVTNFFFHDLAGQSALERVKALINEYHMHHDQAADQDARDVLAKAEVLAADHTANPLLAALYSNVANTHRAEQAIVTPTYNSFKANLHGTAMLESIEALVTALKGPKEASQPIMSILNIAGVYGPRSGSSHKSMVFEFLSKTLGKKPAWYKGKCKQYACISLMVKCFGWSVLLLLPAGSTSK